MKALFIGLAGMVCLLLSIPALAQQSSAKYGALAVDRSDGFYYGFAYDYDTPAAAEARSLEECRNKGGNCSVVLVWQGSGCAVYRTIDGAVGTAYGWGVAATRAEADAIATRECLQRSNGKPATNHVWACNANGAYKVVYNAQNGGDKPAPVVQSSAAAPATKQFISFNGTKLEAWGDCPGEGTAAVSTDDESLILIFNNFTGRGSQSVNANFYTDGCTGCLSVQLQDINQEKTYIATAGNVSTHGNVITVDVTVKELMELFSGGSGYRLTASFSCEE